MIFWLEISTKRALTGNSVDTITYDEIDQRWAEMGGLELSEIPALVDNLKEQQPFVFTYLMATGSELLNQNEREALLFMGIMVWEIAENGSRSLPMITGELLDSKEEKNIEMLEYLAGEPETEFMETVEKIMECYPQAELLKYIIDRLMEEPDKGVALRDDSIGMMVLYLKTLIDCMDTVYCESEIV